MKKLVLMLALSAVAVFLFAPAASTTSHYCGYDGYYDDDDYYYRLRLLWGQLLFSVLLRG